MNAIKLNEVCFSYEENGVPVVKNINLSIKEGEFIAVLGHNGSGKSTLAKLLNGLLLPTSGEVIVFGNSTADDNHIYDIRSKVGMVFQNPDNQMIAGIIEDDIAFGPENLGIERKEIVERVDWALNSVGMLEHKKGVPFKMSGGQKQRIAIAGILAMKPKVLVLDESTAMLDPIGRKNIMNVLHTLNKKENITIIHITHYPDEAIDATRVIVLSDGRIVADDTPDNIFNGEIDLKEYGIKPPMVTELSKSLKNSGLNVDITTNKEELANSICRLLQKK